MFKLARLGLFAASFAGTILTMASQWNMRDKVIDAYGYTDEANSLLIHYGNTVSTPMLLLSFACLILGLLLPKLLRKA